jgi:hypothetical protein
MDGHEKSNVLQQAEFDEATGLEAACLALDRSATSLAESCGEIRSTLSSLDAALGGMAHAGGAPGDYGILGLPIQAAIKAARGVATQVVRQQTGSSLDEWTMVVAGTVAAFDDYVDCLATTSASLRISGSNGVVSPEALAERLQELEWRTRDWKPVLVHLGQLGGVVDAVRTGITASTREEDAEAVDGAAPRQEPRAAADKFVTGFKKATNKATGAVTSAVSNVVAKPNPWQDVLLAPFVDITERVEALPRTVQAVTTEVETLELLVDVAQAQVAVALGESSPEEARLVAVRAHAVIDVPALARDIERTRAQVAAADAAIDRLAGAVGDGRIDTTTGAALDAEYREARRTAEARVRQLDATLAAWRDEGTAMLDTCIEAATAQLRTLEARAIAEDTDRYADRCHLLRHEITLAEQASAHVHAT